MGKLVLFFLFAVGTVAVGAQYHTDYVSILPGYHFAAGKTDFNYSSSTSEERAARYADGLSSSVSYGHYFSEQFALHVSLIYASARFSRVDWHNFIPWPGYRVTTFNKSFTILEVGPEMSTGFSDKQQFYAKLGVGYVLSVGKNRNNSIGAALGYRLFVSDNLAMNFEADYHHVRLLSVDALTSARVGVIVRFQEGLDKQS